MIDPNIPGGGGLNWLESLLFAGFAAVGGALGYLMRQSTRNRKILMGRCALEAVASAFVGVIAMLVCKATGLDWMWSGVVVGTFGWLGAEATIMVIINVVRKKLGLDISNFADGDRDDAQK